MEYGLIGYPLKHSFSKEIHEMISSYDYDLLEIKKDELENLLLKANFKGLNVTIPYKQEVIKYLNEIDSAANSIGAVNTILNDNGKLKGYNTDFYGLLSLINKIGCDIKNKNVLILGTGATSNTAYAVCQYLDACSITKVARKKNNLYPDYSQINLLNDKFDIIINTTPNGMYPHNNDDLLVDLDKMDNLQAVIDVIYNPINTSLLLQAKERNIKAIGGLYMLVSQAVYASSLFLKREFDKNITEQIYKKILFQKQNIVLIGMPSCGKSTIGKILADRLGRDFYDIDDIIIEKNKKNIVDIFKNEGEECFRKYEENAVNSIYQHNGVVISTGGGTILRKNNVDLLKQNGILVFLDRDIDKLQADQNRPLASSINKIKELYSQRYSLYCNYADFIVKNNDTIDTTIKNILMELNK